MGDGKFAFGFIAGILALILIYLFWPSVGSALEVDQWIDLFPSIIAISVAFLSVWLSYQALQIQHRMRQAGTDPVILVHLGSREDEPLLVTAEITNVGAGAACNVDVKFNTDLSRFTPDRIMTNFEDDLYPIKVIPQGQAVSFLFGTGPNLLKDPQIPPIHIHVKYEDIEGMSYHSDQLIDLKELTAQTADKAPLALIAASLKKLEKHSSERARKDRKFHVITQDIDHFRSEEQRRYEEQKAAYEARQHKD
ncbi:COG1361 family protein [Alterinioella nitratireducens]|uniref:hypothetical protein n=1 Tax=Alterinioella nitratireducens TaxID=2735915 RepID=UPI0015538DCF|nr:hypothetical protein [Alterinioella nitratireducens]NPD19665.1 hypothetical protein [Alterinioella nitratireducens]